MKLKKNIEINKLLVIRLSSMGDVILTTPIVRVLKNTFPKTEIDFLTSTYFNDIYRFNPYINRVIIYDKSKSISENKNLKNTLEKNEYDLIIDLQNNRRSNALTSGLKINILKVKKQRLHKLSMVYFKKPIIENFSIVQNYFDALSPLNIKPDGKGLEIWTESEFEEKKYLFSKSPETNSIAIAPSANHFTKRWQPDKFAALAKSLIAKYGFEVILTGGKNDKKLCEYIYQIVGDGLTDKSGSESIIETVETIDKTKLLVTNDTGIMHIAAARHIPVVAIFGSSVKELGFLPYKVDYKIIEKELNCRPCSHIGRKSCPKGHFNCMNLIEPEEVLNEVLKMITKNPFKKLDTASPTN